MMPSIFRSGALACAGISLFISAGHAQEDITLKTRKDCLTVELMMYSGRPRPKYLLCEDADKKAALDKVSEAQDEKAADLPYPAFDGTPLYQGVLLTLPRNAGEAPSRILIRKGFVKKSGSGKILVDKERSAERFFLNRSLEERDQSDSPTGGADLTEQAESALNRVQEESQAK